MELSRAIGKDLSALARDVTTPGGTPPFAMGEEVGLGPHFRVYKSTGPI